MKSVLVAAAFLAISLPALADTNVGASSVPVTLRGAQITTGFQEQGDRYVSTSSGNSANWVKTATGLTCKASDAAAQKECAADPSEDCLCQVQVSNSIYFNISGYLLNTSNTTLYFKKGNEWVASVDFTPGKSLTTAELDAIKKSAVVPTPNLSEDFLEKLYGAQRQTVYADHGTCYVYEADFFANASSKVIDGDVRFEMVAAHCP